MCYIPVAMLHIPVAVCKVYMVPANESFYQISTPNADGSKKRRISASMVPDRLSVIPPLFEKSFIQDDSSDFEVSLRYLAIIILLHQLDI